MPVHLGSGRLSKSMHTGYEFCAQPASAPGAPLPLAWSARAPSLASSASIIVSPFPEAPSPASGPSMPASPFPEASSDGGRRGLPSGAFPEPGASPLFVAPSVVPEAAPLVPPFSPSPPHALTTTPAPAAHHRE